MADTDLNLSSISSISKFEMPMSLPWHPSSTIRLGALFHSDRANEEDPWAKETLFTQSSLESIPVHYRSDEGARSFFKSSVSSTSSQFEDHMSIWLGVSLGCPILGASVSGQYDRHVINNRRTAKSSIRASHRSGVISLTKPPSITEEAKRIIKYDGGMEALTERFGDFYVGGYALGGDTGALASAASADSLFYKRLKIVLKIRVLFINVYKTLVDETQSFQFAFQSETFSGFDSLSNTYVSASAKQGSRPEDALAAAGNLANLAQTLNDRVSEKIVQTGLHENEPLSKETCERVFKSGLVAEVLLFPVAQSRDVLVWRNNSDII